jgi:cellulose synthase/poly-beta-1,6-N-acetylglucosamine synthase-like glycosyltransferase
MMLEKLEMNDVKLAWIGAAPTSEKRVALLIPQFNEGSQGDLITRLVYYKGLAERYKSILDVIIIDDGSTDGSLEKIELFKEEFDDAFFACSVCPNSNKVGALFLATLSISHEFVVQSDFDTDIVGLERLSKYIALLEGDTSLMGGYFRMLPFEGLGSVFLFQQLEYSMARAFYKFHIKDRSVPVMPGAGCFYRREALIEIYHSHSGLRSGEDREATLLGLKLGYKTIYFEDILTLTRPPLSFRSLIKQRIRWNLGYIETFFKERGYYHQQTFSFTRMGIRTILDLLTISIVILMPIIILIGAWVNWRMLIIFLFIFYICSMLWSVNTILIAPKESFEFKSRRINSVLFYPIYKVLLDSTAWIGAILRYVKNR